MRRFKVDNPNDWEPFPSDQLIKLDVRRTRRVRLQLNSTGPASLWIANNSEMANARLLGTTDGQAEFVFTAGDPAYLEVKSEPGTVVYMRHFAPTHSVEGRELPSFTNLEPRGTPTELTRILHLVKLNERARQAQLDNELKPLREARLAQERAEKRAAWEAEQAALAAQAAAEPTSEPPVE